MTLPLLFDDISLGTEFILNSNLESLKGWIDLVIGLTSKGVINFFYCWVEGLKASDLNLLSSRRVFHLLSSIQCRLLERT